MRIVFDCKTSGHCASQVVICIIIMQKAFVRSIPRVMFLLSKRVAVKAALVLTPLALVAAPNVPLRKPKSPVHYVPYLPQQFEKLRGRRLRNSPTCVGHHLTVHGTRNCTYYQRLSNGKTQALIASLTALAQSSVAGIHWLNRCANWLVLFNTAHLQLLNEAYKPEP